MKEREAHLGKAGKVEKAGKESKADLGTQADREKEDQGKQVDLGRCIPEITVGNQRTDSLGKETGKEAWVRGQEIIVENLLKEVKMSQGTLEQGEVAEERDLPLIAIWGAETNGVQEIQGVGTPEDHPGIQENMNAEKGRWEKEESVTQKIQTNHEIQLKEIQEIQISEIQEIQLRETLEIQTNVTLGIQTRETLETQECRETQGTLETQGTQEVQGTLEIQGIQEILEIQGIRESQGIREIREIRETQENEIQTAEIQGSYRTKKIVVETLMLGSVEETLNALGSHLDPGTPVGSPGRGSPWTGMVGTGSGAGRVRGHGTLAGNLPSAIRATAEVSCRVTRAGSPWITTPAEKARRRRAPRRWRAPTRAGRGQARAGRVAQENTFTWTGTAWRADRPRSPARRGRWGRWAGLRACPRACLHQSQRARRPWRPPCPPSSGPASRPCCQTRTPERGVTLRAVLSPRLGPTRGTPSHRR